MASLKGKAVIITGASSGMGAAAAVGFAKLGCLIAINGRNAENLNKTKQAAIQAGAKEDQVVSVIGDVTEHSVLEKLVNETVKKFGKVDVLINNAGMSTANASVVKGPLEEYDKIMNINVRSIVDLTKLAIPHLRKSRGTIINISSVAGLRPSPLTYYGMSKACVDQFTQCLALELAGDGIRVNAINPGFIKSNFRVNMGMDKNTDTALADKIMCQTHALGRVGEANEVVDAMIFLASEQSAFITGQLLKVDGGATLMGASTGIWQKEMEKAK